MSLFIGSAPRLAERHRLRCRLPSRHLRMTRFLRPTPPPGLGAFLFPNVQGVSGNGCRGRRLRLWRVRSTRGENAVDPSQVVCHPRQALRDAALEMAGERSVLEHLRAYCSTRDLETEHAIARDDRRPIRMLDQHGHLADERARLDGPGGGLKVWRFHVLCQPRYDEIRTVTRLAGLGDDISALKFDALGLPRQLGELQWLEPGEKWDAQQRRNQSVDGHARQGRAIRVAGPAVLCAPPPPVKTGRGNPLTAPACSRLFPSPAARRVRGPSRSSAAAGTCGSRACA